MDLTTKAQLDLPDVLIATSGAFTQIGQPSGCPSQRFQWIPDILRFNSLCFRSTHHLQANLCLRA